MSNIIAWITVKTNFSNMWFNDEGHDDEFRNWLMKQLYDGDSHLYDLKLSIDKTFEGLTVTHIVAKLSDNGSTFDNNGNISIDIDIETTDERDTNDADDLFDNKEFSDFISEKLIPAYTNEFNSMCNLAIPVVNGNSFEGLIFEDGKFYLELDEKGSTNRVQMVTFKLEDELVDIFY